MAMNMKLNLSALGKIKLGLHTLQGILILIAICVFIAMASKEGHSDGRGRFYGVMCFLTIPVLIYMTGVPMWERTRKFANVWAFLALDTLTAIFWLAAWAGLVAWVRAGQRAGAAEKKIDIGSSNCTTFLEKEFGTQAKCNLANTCVGFGVAIFALFVGTAIVSYLYFRKIRNDSTVKEPWLGKSTAYKPADAALESGAGDNAWSADMHEDSSYGAQHNRRGSNGTEHGGDKEEDEYRLLQGGADPAGHRQDSETGYGRQDSETGYGRHPGQPWEESSYGRPGREDEDDHAYHGAAAPPYTAPSALSPTDYGPAADRPGRGRTSDRTSFPAAPYGYDRGTDERR